MALKAVDLDFRSLSVRVERAVTDGGRVKGTKTHETRIVDLTPDLAAALKRHLAWVKAESLRSGSGDREWLFPTQEGTLMDKDHLGGIFRCLLKRAGLPHHRVYDHRHTYASLLLADGAPLTYVSAQLGHANPDHHAAPLRQVDAQEGEAVGQCPRQDRRAPFRGAKKWSQRAGGVSVKMEVPENIGSPGRSRTCDILINSESQEQTQHTSEELRPREPESWA
jgi:integrase